MTHELNTAFYVSSGSPKSGLPLLTRTVVFAGNLLQMEKENYARGYSMAKKKNIEADEQEENKLNEDQIIALMDVYLCEWTHRDNLLWSQVFRFFFASLFVIMLPNLAEGFGIKLPSLGDWIYRFVGGIMAFVFWYVSVGYSYRLAAIGNTYQKLINLLGDDYKRESIKDKTKFKCGWFFSKRMAFLISCVMFFALIFLDIILCVR